MKARFIGDPADGFSGADVLDYRGVAFRKDEWTGISAEMGAKLATHSHFEVDVDGDGEPDPSAAELRAILDGRGVTYRANASVETLKSLVAASEPPPAG
jgi:hypothetical protein